MSEHAGAARWLTIHDELLRGLAHALSNRVATIDAATYMLALDGADVASQTATLRGESERLESLLNALRTLPRRADGAAEPVMAKDAVQGALALHAHLGDLRAVPCDVSIDPDVAPAYADPVALQHALLVAMTAARTAAQRAGNGTRVHVRVSGHTDVVRFTVNTVGADHSSARDLAAERDRHADFLAIDWLLGARGGRSEPDAGATVFTVPTLMAARTAERDARAPR